MRTIKSKGQGQALSEATNSANALNDQTHRLPSLVLQASDEPLTVIEPSGTWNAINLRELWTYRELLYFLIWRDVKIRYKQTVLGAAWAIIQPLFTMLVFTLIFSRVAGISSEGIPYPLFAYAGLLPWIFFANAVTTSGNSLVVSANLITKVYFPRLLIPAAAVGAGVVDFAVAFVMLIPLMIYYHATLTLSVFLLPIPIVLTVLLTLAVGIWLSALNVKYRDVRFAVPFMMQFWMFLSPVAYPSSALPQRWQLLYSLNPAVGIIEGFRASLLGQPLKWTNMGISTFVTLGLLLYASLLFRKMEKKFADII
ncbi:MAG: ABC transporter permease [Pyrinomonadaceae bacterium]|nr:ABC transporter permease [Pyrinomonadaceae bacterium]